MAAFFAVFLEAAFLATFFVAVFLAAFLVVFFAVVFFTDVLAAFLAVFFAGVFLAAFFTAFLAVFFVVFFNAFQGVREVDQRLIDNCRVLGASTWQSVRNVVIPSALTWIIASLHVAFGFAVIGAIVGEFLGATRGLGLVIATAQNQFDPNGVFAMMLVIGLIALTAEWLIELLEHRVLGWRPPTRSQTASL